MKDQDTIHVGQILKIPGGDCLKDGEKKNNKISSTTPSSSSGNVTTSSSEKNICKFGGKSSCRCDALDLYAKVCGVERMSTGGIVMIVLLVLVVVSLCTFSCGYYYGKKKNETKELQRKHQTGPTLPGRPGIAMGTKV